MNLRHDPNVLAFIQAAREYGGLIETPPADRRTGIRLLSAALAKLYATAQRLPDPALQGAADPGDAPVSDEEWHRHYKRLGQWLGVDDYYWGLWSGFGYKDSPGGPPVPTLASTADDLADVYRDVIAGLRRWDGVESDAGAIVAEWKATFLRHWGIHALSVLRALHALQG